MYKIHLIKMHGETVKFMLLTFYSDVN